MSVSPCVRKSIATSTSAYILAHGGVRRAAPARAWRGAAGSWQGTHVLRDCGAPQAAGSQGAYDTDASAQTAPGVIPAAATASPGGIDPCQGGLRLPPHACVYEAQTHQEQGDQDDGGKPLLTDAAP